MCQKSRDQIRSIQHGTTTPPQLYHPSNPLNPCLHKPRIDFCYLLKVLFHILAKHVQPRIWLSGSSQSQILKRILEGEEGVEIEGWRCSGVVLAFVRVVGRGIFYVEDCEGRLMRVVGGDGGMGFSMEVMVG